MASSQERPTSRLRVLVEDDWAVWRALRIRALSENPEAFSSKLADWQGPGDLEARWRLRLSAVGINLVCAFHDLDAGMLSVTRPNAEGEVEIISMWVSAEARGQGVGDCLIQAALRWAQEQGASAVRLDVFERNSRAIAFYQRHGFRITIPTQGKWGEEGCELGMIYTREG